MLYRNIMATHQKCLNQLYPRSKIQRTPLDLEQISWGKTLPDYNPPDYTSDSVIGKAWADPDLGSPNFHPRWNELDGTVDRRSYVGKYSFSSGRPLNPIGRTGLQGRGVLGKWGPNHAADPVVTRWARDHNSEVLTDSQSQKRILQFVSIQRRDSGEWALPGGMVDPGEVVTDTVKREFMEEALNSLELSDDEKEEMKKKLEKLFQNGDEVYRGYVDDPRNTDNAWMETVAVNFHDEKGDLTEMALTAGDDAVSVQWVNISRDLKLYASHIVIIKKVVELRNAFW